MSGHDPLFLINQYNTHDSCMQYESKSFSKIKSKIVKIGHIFPVFLWHLMTISNGGFEFNEGQKCPWKRRIVSTLNNHISIE